MPTIITASEFKNHYGEVFDKARLEPVIIQKHHRNSLIMIAFEAYQKLQDRLAELEEYKLVQEMEFIKKSGQFIQGEEAIDKLKLMANG